MSALSPFARKIRMLALEVGLADRLEEVHVTVTPQTVNPQVGALNPLGKIPVLVRDDGEPLYDSPVIAEYLDSLHCGSPLIPVRGESRWRALRHQALADGLMDAAVLLRYETALRPQALRWDDWANGQQAKIEAALDELAVEVDALAES
ncbi:glutathione S-transferase N-terminal domain-containing protein, partial [Stenotrophomonas sp. YIM B06876]|uniref:glutathione S-transferase N-terminal domain-containing protein n=1 Tax=Stenotrophomonas sp. YIM B06876 TaxID=3060211 RepID=UPI002739781C